MKRFGTGQKLLKGLILAAAASLMVAAVFITGGFELENTAEGARSCERRWFSRCLQFPTFSFSTTATTTTSPTTTTSTTTTAPDSCASLTLLDTGGALIASGVAFPPTGSTGCLLLQVVPEPNSAFPAAPAGQQVNAAGLFGTGSTEIPSAPVGRTRITPAVQYSQVSPTGSAAGVSMCFAVPASAGTVGLGLFYYETDPAIDRWVALDTTVDSGLACMDQTLRFPPRVFALFFTPA